jgi:T-complex protein 1 subunit zeta
VSLEYEKSLISAGFQYSNSEQRERMVKAERATTDARVQQVIDLKNQVCVVCACAPFAVQSRSLLLSNTHALFIRSFSSQVCKNGEGFIVINQKGIDPVSLDMLQKAGIVGIRRAKRRNMERLTRACGGTAVNR